MARTLEQESRLQVLRDALLREYTYSSEIRASMAWEDFLCYELDIGRDHDGNYISIRGREIEYKKN